MYPTTGKSQELTMQILTQKNSHITAQPAGPGLLKITFDSSSSTTQDYNVHCQGFTLSNYVERLTHRHIFIMMTIKAFWRTVMSRYDRIYSGLTFCTTNSTFRMWLYLKTNVIFRSPHNKCFITKSIYCLLRNSSPTPIAESDAHMPKKKYNPYIKSFTVSSKYQKVSKYNLIWYLTT